MSADKHEMEALAEYPYTSNFLIEAVREKREHYAGSLAKLSSNPSSSASRLYRGLDAGAPVSAAYETYYGSKYVFTPKDTMSDAVGKEVLSLVPSIETDIGYLFNARDTAADPYVPLKHVYDNTIVSFSRVLELSSSIRNKNQTFKNAMERRPGG